MNPAYRDLMTLAARIPPGSDGGVAKEYLDEACADFARELLDSGADPHAIVGQIEADLAALAENPGANPRAVEHVRNSLMANFDLREAAALPPQRRRSLVPLIAVTLPVLLIGGFFALRSANEIAITRPMDTHEGLVQRARALQKSVAIAKFQRESAGWLGALYGLANAPTADERAGENELTGPLFKISQSLAREGCGVVPDDGSGAPEKEPSGQDLFLDAVSRNLIAMDGKWKTKPSTTLRDAVRGYQCPNRASRPQTGLTQ